MNLGDLTGLVEKPFAAVSNLVNTPNSAGRYRPFYLRNLLDAVQGRTLYDAVDGTITLITGGSSGIGEAAAKKIADAGGEVVLVARTRENLEKVADEIRSSGGTAHVYPCDLSDMDAIAAMADQVLADLGGVVQCAALHRVEQITQVERSVPARRVRRVDEAGHGGDRLLDQTGQIIQIHSFHAPGGDSPGISTESAIPLSSSGASSAIRLLRRVIPR